MKHFLIFVYLFFWTIPTVAQDKGSTTDGPITITPEELLPEITKVKKIFIPKVQGKDHALVNQVGKSVSFEEVFVRNWQKGRTLEDEIKESPMNFFAYYDVLVNRDHILSLGWHTEFYGAGLYKNDNYVVISLYSGKRILATEVFDARALVKMLRKEEMKAIKKKESELKKDGYTEELSDWKKRVLTNLHTLKTLDDFYVTEEGVGFITSKFTGSEQTLNPYWKEIYTWAELKAFIKNPGPLASFLNGH